MQFVDFNNDIWIMYGRDRTLACGDAWKIIQRRSCYGVSAEHPHVCSGRGKCTAWSNCTCWEGASGRECQDFRSFGFNSTDPKVCSGHGVCASLNQCNCTQDYDGPNCSAPKCISHCNGSSCTYVGSDSMNKCFGRGECVSPGKCLCHFGWTGNYCSVPASLLSWFIALTSGIIFIFFICVMDSNFLMRNVQIEVGHKWTPIISLITDLNMKVGGKSIPSTNSLELKPLVPKPPN